MCKIKLIIQVFLQLSIFEQILGAAFLQGASLGQPGKIIF
jgi:hypothetical protein